MSHDTSAFLCLFGGLLRMLTELSGFGWFATQPEAAEA